MSVDNIQKLCTAPLADKNCDFCKAPALEARFRLMEAAYHEDMAEVYKRLDELEEKCQEVYIGADFNE